MTRPLKTGLDYFPLDVDISNDSKVELIEAEFGLKGFAIIIKIFCRIYRNGYYCEWNDDVKLLLAKCVGEPGSLVGEIVSRSIKRGLFNKSVFNKFGILTSSAIQKRYLSAIDRRNNIKLTKEYLLIDVNEYINPVNVTINSINNNISTQSKVKESKVKKRIRDIGPKLHQLFSKIETSFSIKELKQKNEFLEYWMEKNIDGKKERWEMEKVFDIKRRFQRWLKNSEEWGKNGTNRRSNKKIGSKYKDAGITEEI